MSRYQAIQQHRRRGGLADPIRFVRQSRQGCGLACMAMVTGRPIAEVRQELPEPAGDDDMRTWLAQHNILTHNRSMCFANWLHIVTVPSINRPGLLHVVVIDCRHGRKRLYDPNAGRPGRRVVTLEDLNEGHVAQISIWVLQDCRPIPSAKEAEVIAAKTAALKQEKWLDWS